LVTSLLIEMVCYSCLPLPPVADGGVGVEAGGLVFALRVAK
jgi:hypothetical protein